MKIEAKKLKEYVDKVSLDNNIMVLDLDFKEDGVYTKVRNPSNVAMTDGFLSKDNFEEYEPINTIYLKNSSLFCDVLKTFKGEIDIDRISDTELKLSNSSRDAIVLLADKSICDNLVEDDPEFETSASLEMEKRQLNRIVKDMDLLSINEVVIKTKNDKVLFQIGRKNEYDFIINKVSYSGDSEFKVAIGDTLKKVASVISDNFVMELGTDVPVRITDSSEDFKVNTTIAPFISDEN